MQWTDGFQAGFSAAEPWLKVNPNHQHINVAKQDKDPVSVLNYYRRCIAFRKRNLTLVYGDYVCLDTEHPYFYSYKCRSKVSSSQ